MSAKLFVLCTLCYIALKYFCGLNFVFQIFVFKILLLKFFDLDKKNKKG